MEKKHAFTLMEILMVIAIIGLIAAAGTPLFLNAIRTARNRTQDANIASVEAAKKQWAFENGKADGTPVLWSDISNYMGNSTLRQEDLDVDGKSINVNPIGTPGSY
jgi:prepilin-type N-terminal cleavage/methylation domain-containing protein